MSRRNNTDLVLLEEISDGLYGIPVWYICEDDFEDRSYGEPDFYFDKIFLGQFGEKHIKDQAGGTWYFHTKSSSGWKFYIRADQKQITETR
jgi:hypothetical protein